MNLPNRINILGTTYQIKNKKEEGYHGRCDKEKKLITINMEDQPHEILNTFIHEICHAILHESRIDTRLTHDLEELIVWHFADFFSDWLIQKK